MEVVAQFAEDVSGATPITERPEGRKAIDLLRNRQAQALIVHAVDRLSRDLVDALASVRDLTRAGIEVYVYDVGRIGDENDIILVIKAWQASDERKKIAERTARGRNAKAKEGLAVGQGKPPYGYSYSEDELFLKEDEAAIVRLVYQWYAEGDEVGRKASERGIALRLSELGVPTPSESKQLKRRQRLAGVWSPSSIHWILTSEVYCGVLRYGRAIGYGGKGGKRPLSETIKIDVRAIVSRDLWEAAQAQRAYNSRMSKRRGKREYLLRGHVKCGCGRSLVGSKGGYICTENSELYRRCQASRVPGLAVEEIAWKFALRVMIDPVYFESEWRKAQQAEREAIRPKQDQLQTVLALLADCEAEALELAEALRRASSRRNKASPRRGKVAQTLEAQVAATDDRYEALCKKRDTLQAEIAAGVTLTDEALARALQFRQDVDLGFRNPTFEDKRDYFAWLQLEVTVANGKAVVACLFPITETYEIETSRSMRPGRRRRCKPPARACERGHPLDA